MSGPAIFLTIGIVIAILAMFGSRFVHTPSDDEIAQKRGKFLTWWWIKRDRMRGEHH